MRENWLKRGVGGLSLIVWLVCAFPACVHKVERKDDRVQAQHYDEVYVCTGRYAKRFHCDEDCKGLQSCRSEIVVMSIEEAEDYGLTPCGYCY